MRDLLSANAPLALAVGGLVIGFLFGAIVTRTNYCAMGSLSDIHNFGDYRRFRAWVLAAATALAGAQLLQFAGVVDLAKSMYLAPGLNWVGHIVGGWIFGFGMVFAGGCPSRNLSRAGGGDLRSVLTLVVLGLFAYMTIGGIFAPLRATLEQATSLRSLGTSTQSVGEMAGVLLYVAPPTANLGVGLLMAAAGMAYGFGNRAFRNSPVHMLSGLGVGLVVVAGWALTGLAFDEMAAKPSPPMSLSYVRPAGDAIEWLMRFTAAPLPSFAVTSVFGALLGAFAVAFATGRFQIATFSDTDDTLRNLGGAALMGIGGVMALGCTVGQAITGVSTLALGSFLTFAAIIAGGRYGLIVLERRI